MTNLTRSFAAALCFGTLLYAEKPEKVAHPTHSWFSERSANYRKIYAQAPGLQHRSFLSKSMGKKVGFHIYLPKEYESEPNRRFPVVFHLHGGRPGNEWKSMRLAPEIHARINTGVVQPTIYVFPNGGPVSWYDSPQYLDGDGATVFVEELIPFIQKNYRTRELGIEGFSQGGRGTTRIMFRHPELFTSGAPGGSGYATEKKISENAGVESENTYFHQGDNTWDLAAKFLEKPDRPSLPILIWVGTKGFNYQNNRAFSQYLDGLSIEHRLLEVPEAEHNAIQIYELKGDELMKFHQQYFAQP